MMKHIWNWLGERFYDAGVYCFMKAEDSFKDFELDEDQLKLDLPEDAARRVH